MYRRKRNSLRNPYWNYAAPGWYFLTLVTKNRIPFLGCVKDNEVHLSSYGDAVLHCWEQSKHVRTDMRFDSIIIMPDHVHMLVKIKGPAFYRTKSLSRSFGYQTQRSISSFVALFKGACTRSMQCITGKSLAGHFWQRGYDDQIIRDSRSLPAIRRYIRDNPRNASKQ